MNNFDPITRKEHFLAKMGGQDVNNLEPITREEVYLAKAGGQDVTVPDPITREEFFLEDVIENISQGGGSSDLTTAKVTIINTSESGIGTLAIAGLTVLDPESGYLITGSETEVLVCAHNNSSVEYDAVLYNSFAYGFITNGTVTSVSGSIEYNADEGVYNITGDCTITGTGE